MKTLALVALIAFSSPVLAQSEYDFKPLFINSKLPDCEKSLPKISWNNCLGATTVSKQETKVKITLTGNIKVVPNGISVKAYTGEFKNGKYHGLGVMTYDGTRKEEWGAKRIMYRGQWYNGRKNGFGDMYLAGTPRFIKKQKNNCSNGCKGLTVIQAIWNNDIYSGTTGSCKVYENKNYKNSETCIQEDYRILRNLEQKRTKFLNKTTEATDNSKVKTGDEDGEIKSGERQSQSTITFPDGSKYTGELKNNKRHGQGTIEFPDGSSYTGGWKNDEYHGRGKHIKADGSSRSTINYEGKSLSSLCLEEGLQLGSNESRECIFRYRRKINNELEIEAVNIDNA